MGRLKVQQSGHSVGLSPRERNGDIRNAFVNGTNGTEVYLLDFFYSSIQFYLLLSPYFFALSPFISWFICSGRWGFDKGLSCKPNIYVSWSTSELRMRLAPWNRFKPPPPLPSKIFYWPFQGGTSFEDILCFFLCCVCYAFVRVCLSVPCGHLLGKGWPLGSRVYYITVSLSLSHWYPGLGVVLDCIDSWSLSLTYFAGAMTGYLGN